MNGIILEKGFSVYAERRMRQLIKSCEGDAPLKLDSLYSAFAEVDKYYQNKELTQETYNLMKRISRLKKELSNIMASVQKDSVEIGIEWNDIANAMNKEAVAIEFFEVNHYLDDGIDVCAIAFAKDLKPCAFKLFEKTALDSLDIENQCLEIADKIWGLLREVIQNKKVVCFSPSGLLCSIPIEISDVRNIDGERLSFYRLTSTREFLRFKNSNKKQNAPQSYALYGGLDYFRMGQRLVDIAQDQEAQNYSLNVPVDKNTRGRLKDISDQTLPEIEEISSMLKDKGIKNVSFSGREGTEETFKYGIKDATHLHISTHGYYWTEEDAKEEEYDMSFLNASMIDVSKEDKALYRSALLFSGAYSALKGRGTSSSLEDGILTAKEISYMDMENVEFVVLSACQTGLGDIEPGDGVYGLQRGFKKAGVKSILMTLWEVDNAATRLFIVEFYKHYLNGDTKIESLKKAQQYVKSQPGYEDPEYWAGFILLDALN